MYIIFIFFRFGCGRDIVGDNMVTWPAEEYQSGMGENSSLLVPSVIYKTELGAQSKPRIILSKTYIMVLFHTFDI